MVLTLTFAEALVLGDFLHRFSEKEILSIEDQAEERVLWDLECLLEKQLYLDEPYADALAKARAAVRDSTE